MQISPYTPLQTLRGQFSNLHMTAGELGEVLAAPFVPGRVDADGADRLARVQVAVQNALMDADVAQMTAYQFEGRGRLGSAAIQARAGIEALFDRSYDASLYLRGAYETGTISEEFDAGPVAELRVAASKLEAIAGAMLATIDALPAASAGAAA